MPHTAGVGLSGRGLLLRAITVKQFNTGIYKAPQQKPIKGAAKWWGGRERAENFER